MEKMKKVTEDVDTEQLVGNEEEEAEKSSNKAEGVRTRSQRARDMDHTAGGD